MNLMKAAQYHLTETVSDTKMNIPSFDQERIRFELNSIVLEILPLVVLSLGCLYILFGISHILLLPESISAQMTTLALTTSGCLFIIHFLMKRQSVSNRLAHPVSTGIACLAILNSCTHLYLSQDPFQVHNLSLIMLAAGCFFLSYFWLFVVLCIIFGLWFGIVFSLENFVEWIKFFYLLLTSAMVSVLVHTIRIRVYFRQIATLHHLQMTRQQLNDHSMHLEHLNAELTREIQERKNAEKHLETLALVASKTNNGVMILDQDGRIEWVNDGFTRITGYTLTDVINKTPESFLPGPQTRPETVDQFREQIHNKKNFIIDMLNYHKSGDAFWASINISPVWSDTEDVEHYIAIVSNITEQKQAMEEIRQARDEAIAANLAKSQFLATMSHELRTPLNSVIGFASILLKNKYQTMREKELTFIQRIHSNGVHLLALINDILDLSKIEAGRIVFEPASVNLDILIHEVLAQLEDQFCSKHLKLCLDIPKNTLPLHSDYKKLKQIMVNLIGNAVKFTESGSITIRVKTGKYHYPECIEVIDTGIGIPKDRLNTIFNTFQQADSSTTRKYGGTGLGLAVSQSLCNFLGYTLEVQSEEGKGSIFTVNMRSVASVSELSALISQDEDTYQAVLNTVFKEHPSKYDDLKEKTVLIIDDDPDSTYLLLNMIEEIGCRTITAHSPAKGIMLARHYKPDLITLDLMMPEVNGMDVLQEIKSVPELLDIPIVIISIVASELRSEIQGVADFLDKPVDRFQLIDTLQRTLTAPVHK